jgi:toxin CcdB
VPLVPRAGAPTPIKELNPVFDIDGEPHVMLTQPIASIPAKELRRAVASLDGRQGEITRALNILLLGILTAGTKPPCTTRLALVQPPF